MHLHTFSKSHQNKLDCIEIWAEALRPVAHHFHKNIDNGAEPRHIQSRSLQNKLFCRPRVSYYYDLPLQIPQEVCQNCLYNSHHLRKK